MICDYCFPEGVASLNLYCFHALQLVCFLWRTLLFFTCCCVTYDRLVLPQFLLRRRFLMSRAPSDGQSQGSVACAGTSSRSSSSSYRICALQGYCVSQLGATYLLPSMTYFWKESQARGLNSQCWDDQGHALPTTPWSITVMNIQNQIF